MKIEYTDANPRSYSRERGALLTHPSAWSDVFGKNDALQRTSIAATTNFNISNASQSLRSLHKYLDEVTLEPEAVVYALTEVVRRVAQAEKERDEALATRRDKEGRLLDITSQLKDKSDEVLHLKQVLTSTEEGKLI